MRMLPDKTPGGIDNWHLSAEGWHPQVGAPVLVLLLNGHAHPPCSATKDDAAAHQGCFDFDTRSVVDVRPAFEPPYRRKVDARDPGQIVDRPVKRGARHATLYVGHFEAATVSQVIIRCGFAAIYAKRLTVLVLEGASADATGVFCPTLSKRGRLKLAREQDRQPVLWGYRDPSSARAPRNVDGAICCARSTGKAGLSRGYSNALSATDQAVVSMKIELALKMGRQANAPTPSIVAQ